MEKPISVGCALVVALLAGLCPGPATRAAATGVQSGARAAGASDDWWSNVQQDIADAEYEITRHDATSLAGQVAAWQAPNRAHDMRTYFTSSGIRVIPRTGETPAWEWGLSLAGWGRPGSSSEPQAPTLTVDGSRIEYDRGAIIEWYVNDRRGLEQGFTLVSPPPSDDEEDRASSRVHIDLALAGTLQPVIAAGGQAIDFATPEGAKVLHYAALAVHDAAGRELRAWMEGFNGPGTVSGIRIVFEDGEAVYPVTVDPLATSPSWMVEGDQPHTALGFSVATAGDVNGDGYADVIVGAYVYDNGQFDEGQAYVYHGSAAGLATSPAWTAESDQGEAYFGYSVATAGDVNGDGYADVIVGAIAYDNGQSDEGRAYVYHGSASGLATSAAWTAESDQAGAKLGWAVATAADVNGDGYSDVIVGAAEYDNNQTDEGRAFVYLGSAAGLATSAAWTAENDQADSSFGGSVATAGDIDGDGYADVIVGAYAYDNGQNGEGRAYVYRGSPAGLETHASWTAESNSANAAFGVSVATAGDVNGDGYADVLVGASSYSSGQTFEGRAYVFHGSAAGLQASAAWTVESNQVGAFFGRSVATAGDVNGDGYADAIVGAPGLGEASIGQAFVYRGSATGLATSPAWTAVSDRPGSEFGRSAATAGDVNGDGYADVIVGASYINSNDGIGRAFVYHGSAAGLATTAGWTAESNQVSAGLGISVATAGDVNGDGYADVIVGADRYDNGQEDEGRAFVYHGSAAGLSTTPAWTVESDQAGALFGNAVATAGDVNGDGYADVLVGAVWFDNGQTDEGRVYAYHGSAMGLSTTPDWTAESNKATAIFGGSVATAGDVNGDGYADVIIGAHGYENGEHNEGRAFAYHGSAAGLQANPVWIVESDQPEAELGFSVATAGDVNGDGYSDVIVGAISFSNGQAFEGSALAYHGSAAGLATSASWTTEGDQAFANFGISVSTAGDVNGDGYADVIVGAGGYDNGQKDEGRACVYLGSPAGVATSPAWTAEGDQADALFGWSVATAGDVNGDGYADVIVGATFFASEAGGQASVYHGSVAGLGTSPAWTAASDDAGAQFGTSVATAGDVDGDGYADVIVGAVSFNNDETDEGRAFVYYGNDGPGLSLRPQQRRAADTGPIAHLGASDSLDSFRLGLLGRTPFGRGKVKLEWEVKPLGTLFDGTNTETSSDWTDTETAGASLSELASNLAQATPQHWRARLHYDPVTTPFQQYSRWLTVPWGGWQEWMLRTAAPAVAAGRADSLVADKSGGGQITLSWGDSCLVTDTDYAIYEGTLGDFASHASLLCTTGGATAETFTPSAGNTYYLVVPQNAGREGSYGKDSGNAERPPGNNACLPQQIGACE